MVPIHRGSKLCQLNADPTKHPPHKNVKSTISKTKIPNSATTSSMELPSISSNRTSNVSIVTGYEDELKKLQVFNGAQNHPTRSTNSLQLDTRIGTLESERNDLKRLNQNLQLQQQQQKSTNDDQLKELTEIHLLELARVRGQLQFNSMELASKECVIDDLKQKITQLFCELQSQRQAVVQAEKSQANTTIELNLIRKSIEWYQSELHRCQNVNTELQKQLQSLEQEKCLLGIEGQTNVAELRQLQRRLDEVQHDKMLLSKRLESSQQQQQLHHTLAGTANCTDEIAFCQNCLSQQFIIDDLTHQLKIENKVSVDCGHRIAEVEAENVQLQTNNAIVQHNLNDKLLIIETCQNYISHFEHSALAKASEIDELQQKIQITTQELDKLNQIKWKLSTIEIESIEKVKENENLKHKLNESIVANLRSDSLLSKSNIEIERLTAELDATRQNVIDSNASLDQLRTKNHDLSSELAACQGLIERYEREKERIEENISLLTKSSISDRNKYELIKREKDDLSMKLQLLNDQLHHINNNMVVEPNHKQDSDRVFWQQSFDAACQTDEKCNVVEVAADDSSVKHLKILIKVLEKEHSEKIKRYELNMRTLLKKVRSILYNKTFVGLCYDILHL